MKTLIAALLLILSALPAFAIDQAQWGKDAAKAYAECSFGATIVLSWREAEPKDFEKSRACVESKLDVAKTAYHSLGNSTPPAARAALNDYYAAWVAAMRSVPGLLGKSKAQAGMIDSANTQRLNELWARYEIEAGL